MNLKRKFPLNPLILEKYYSFLHENNFDFFYELKEYINIKLNWLKKFKLDHKFQHLIPWQVFCGSLGNTHNASTLIQAKELGLIDDYPISYINSNKDLITNKTLFTYFEKRINIIKDLDFTRNTLFLEKYFKAPLDLGVSPFKRSYFINEFSKNQILQKKYKENLNKSFFNLTKEHLEEGNKKLARDFGISSNDWFVTVHARSGSTKNDYDYDSFKNSHIKKFNKSIEFIVNLGGKVFIMGNKKMPIVKTKKGVIDYAHHEKKSDFWDVYLSARSRFYLGTDSGHMVMADYFGVPSLISETPLISTLIGMNRYDLFLPRLLKDNKNGMKMKLKEYFTPDYISIQTNVEKSFKNKGLALIENTDEDILDATKELMDRTSPQSRSIKNFNLGKLQKEFIEKGNQLLKKNFSLDLVVHTAPSEKFLEKNSDIIN